MNTRSAGTAVLVAAATLVGWCLLAADAPADEADGQPNPEAVKAFMRGKLDASQQILEGLVTEDFESIERGADQLRLMSTKAEWNVIRGDLYADQSASFRRSAELLAKMAKENNVDGAALTYLHMTMQCVECHKFTRGKSVVHVGVDEGPALASQ